MDGSRSMDGGMKKGLTDRSANPLYFKEGVGCGGSLQDFFTASIRIPLQ
jgi:hypothetical protein